MARDYRSLTFHIAYHPSPYPHAMRQDLQEIAEVCDGIYMPFAESDLLYAPNKLKYCVQIAHDMGLVVIADFWGYGNLFACGAIPSLFTLQHPEHNCVSSLGKPVLKSCPNKPAVRAFMRGAIEDFVARFEPDGIFWDEPHWELAEYLGKLDEGAWVCRCPDCMTGFRAEYGHEMPALMTQEVAAFRTSTILRFLNELCGSVKACGDHLVTSTCVMPGDALAFKEAVGKTERLDVFGIDPYWRPDCDVSQKEYIEQHTGEAARIGRENGTLVESWVCAWNLTAGHEADAYKAAKLMAEQDIDCISAWSYRDYVSWAPADKPNPADPERVWKNLRRAFYELREGDLEIRL